MHANIYVVIQDEEMLKKNKSEEESLLDPIKLKQKKEAEEQAERHNADKTAHYSKLGQAFIRKEARGGGQGGGGADGQGKRRAGIPLVPKDSREC